MPYEYATAVGVMRLFRTRQRWAVELNGFRRAKWSSADAAARAVARHKTGLPEVDRSTPDVPDDLLDWRPLGDSL